MKRLKLWQSLNSMSSIPYLVSVYRCGRLNNEPSGMYTSESQNLGVFSCMAKRTLKM